MKKRWICVLCVLLSAISMSMTAVAAETYENMGELYQHWSMNGMPDWVCAVVSADGYSERLAVVVNSQAAAGELAAMVKEHASVEIIVAEGSYGYNELLKAQEEISGEYMRADGKSPVVSVGTGLAIIDNKVVGFGESGKELRVVVGVLKEYAEEYRALFQKRYGDMVYVDVTEQAVLTEDMGLREQLPLETASHKWYLWGAAVLCVIAAGVFWQSRRRARAK